MSNSIKDLFSKYDVAAPRYTSYPTVPYWEQAPSSSQWADHLRGTMAASESSWSMYLHIPYCETLCTFCGCNTIITKDHKRENPYVEMLLTEWENYLREVPELRQRPLHHIHLGGGTPTFLSAAHLTKLLSTLLKDLKIVNSNFEASIEVDPRRTHLEQLRALRELGFNRVSLGVQDFNPEVQSLVNRIQPFEITERITQQSRDQGFESVNFDLIYGLAKQTKVSMEETVKKTIQLRPDRIALYSFALVPWIKPAQRLFKDEDLPAGPAKRALYEIAREMLLAEGYVEVGMDHFALPTDSLAIALNQGRLHRNFMGYTNQKTDLLLGLGVSSISESPFSFHQNEKVLPVYEEKVRGGRIPTLRGHLLSPEDQKRRGQILELMTKYHVAFESSEQELDAKSFLKEMLSDHLIEIHDHQREVTEKGRPFLRNACMFFDQRLRRKQPDAALFSKSI
jgi:oxygen-independent coproporphyrinogen-3 oxidase